MTKKRIRTNNDTQTTTRIEQHEPHQKPCSKCGTRRVTPVVGQLHTFNLFICAN